MKWIDKIAQQVNRILTQTGKAPIPEGANESEVLAHLESTEPVSFNQLNEKITSLETKLSETLTTVENSTKESIDKVNASISEQVQKTVTESMTASSKGVMTKEEITTLVNEAVSAAKLTGVTTPPSNKTIETGASEKADEVVVNSNEFFTNSDSKPIKFF